MAAREIFDIRLMHWGRAAHDNGFAIAYWDEATKEYLITARFHYGQAIHSDEEFVVHRTMALSRFSEMVYAGRFPEPIGKGNVYDDVEDVVQDWRLTLIEEDGKQAILVLVGERDEQTLRHKVVATFQVEKDEDYDGFEAKTQALAMIMKMTFKMEITFSCCEGNIQEAGTAQPPDPKAASAVVEQARLPQHDPFDFAVLEKPPAAQDTEGAEHRQEPTGREPGPAGFPW